MSALIRERVVERVVREALAGRWSPKSAKTKVQLADDLARMVNALVTVHKLVTGRIDPEDVP